MLIKSTEPYFICVIQWGAFKTFTLIFEVTINSISHGYKDERTHTFHSPNSIFRVSVLRVSQYFLYLDSAHAQEQKTFLLLSYKK